MKKLGKLTINPEKVIKNEELVNLRGGYDGYGSGTSNCTCSYSYTDGREGGILSPILLPESCSTTGCTTECNTVYGSQYPGAIIIGMCHPG